MITVVIADRLGKGQNVAKEWSKPVVVRLLFQEWALICV